MSLVAYRGVFCRLEASSHEEYSTNGPESKDLCGKVDQIWADICHHLQRDAADVMLCDFLGPAIKSDMVHQVLSHLAYAPLEL